MLVLNNNLGHTQNPLLECRQPSGLSIVSTRSDETVRQISAHPGNKEASKEHSNCDRSHSDLFGFTQNLEREISFLHMENSNNIDCCR